MDEKTRALLEELRAKPGPWLLATDVAPVMRWNPQCVRLKGQRGDLPFSAEAHGSRVQIYKKAFLAWAEENL